VKRHPADSEQPGTALSRRWLAQFTIIEGPNCDSADKILPQQSRRF